MSVCLSKGFIAMIVEPKPKALRRVTWNFSGKSVLGYEHPGHVSQCAGTFCNGAAHDARIVREKDRREMKCADNTEKMCRLVRGIGIDCPSER